MKTEKFEMIPTEVAALADALANQAGRKNRDDDDINIAFRTIAALSKNGWAVTQKDAA
jgi:hypothetical protein